MYSRFGTINRHSRNQFYFDTHKEEVRYKKATAMRESTGLLAIITHSVIAAWLCLKCISCKAIDYFVIIVCVALMIS